MRSVSRAACFPWTSSYLVKELKSRCSAPLTTTTKKSSRALGLSTRAWWWTRARFWPLSNEFDEPWTHTHTLLYPSAPLPSCRHVPRRRSWEISAWRNRKHSSIRKPAYVRGEAVFLLLRVVVFVTVLAFLTTLLWILPPSVQLFFPHTPTRDKQSISYSTDFHFFGNN